MSGHADDPRCVTDKAEFFGGWNTILVYVDEEKDELVVMTSGVAQGNLLVKPSGGNCVRIMTEGAFARKVMKEGGKF